MTTLNISLPDALREFVERQVAEGGYRTAGEYLHELIREDLKRKELEKLEALLLEGLDSGPGVEATPEWWEQFRADLLQRHQDRQHP
jgi:antitoxin ParD1/3/4